LGGGVIGFFRGYIKDREAISFEKRRGIVDGYIRDDETHMTVERLGIAAMETTEA
jgi:hypothetical protein